MLVMAHRYTATMVGGPHDGRQVLLPDLARERRFPYQEQLGEDPTDIAAVMTMRQAVYRHDPLACDPFEAELLGHHLYQFVGVRS